MTSITRSNPILHSMQGGASVSSHRPIRDTRITIMDCKKEARDLVIPVFERFLTDLNKYSNSLPAITPPEEYIIVGASKRYIHSIEQLRGDPITRNTTIIAITIFNQLLPEKEYFNDHSLNEIKTALQTFLSGSETLKRPTPIHADGSRVSPQSTKRDSSPEVESSSRSADSPLTTSTAPSSTSKNPILPSMQGGPSASSHRPTRDTGITIANCDPKVINVFKRFLVELNRYSNSLPAITPPEEYIIVRASEQYIHSIEKLRSNPTTYSSTIIAITIFNQLLPEKEYFNDHSLNEIKIALETFLSGSETLKRPTPIQADGSRVSPQSTVRDSSPEIERSSGSSESLQSSIESIPEDSAIPEEIDPEIEQDAIPEEIEEDAYLDDFSPEEALPASATHLPARAHRT